jgi:3-dehydroquinate dehydratase-2
MNVLVIHGPNLNLLGTREPEVYGKDTLDDVNRLIESEAKSLEISVRTFQSNSEGDLIDAIHEARGWADVLIINPGAYTHTSIAIRDALSGVAIPAIEVHLSNVHARERWRHHLAVAPAAAAVIAGMGPASYDLGLRAAADLLARRA